MIKTININLSGIVFHINEDAYGKLNKYLSSVRSKFRNTEGGDEIIADIESRIAELFNEKLDGKRQVIETLDVDEVVATMGQPEEYEVEEDEEYTSTRKKTTNNKRFFRDPDDKILGGVSSGIGSYINVDTVWIRLIWILLFFGYGFGFIIYIILWIIIPEATTTSEKLEMKGEPVNIENIERKIKEEFDGLKDSFSKMGEHAKNADYAKAGKKAQSALAHGVEMVLSILGRILTFVFKFLGVILILSGVIAIPAILFGLSVANTSFSEIFYDGSLYEMFNAFFNSSLQLTIAIISVLLIAIIPLVLILLAGLRILMGKSYVNTLFVIILGIIWFASATSIATIAADNTLNFNSKSSITEQETLAIESDTIFIKADNSNYYSYGTIFNNDNVSMHKSEDGDLLLFNNFDLDIKASKTKSTELRIKKYANGHTRLQALDRVKKINYSYKVEGNTVIFDDYLSTPIGNKIRNQKVKAILFIPIGTVIYFDDNMNDFLGHVDNVNDYWGYQMLNHYWLMTKDGLECIDCNDKKTTSIRVNNLRKKSDKSMINDSKIFNDTLVLYKPLV